VQQSSMDVSLASDTPTWKSEAAATASCCYSARLLQNADGRMGAWDGRGTKLPLGFSALRIRTKWLQCWATENLPDEQLVAERWPWLRNPVHVLCRTLRMAPPCYREIELVVDQQLKLVGGGDRVFGNIETQHRGKDGSFDSVNELAVAMRPFTCEEGLSVHILPDKQSLVVHRIPSTPSSSD